MDRRWRLRVPALAGSLSPTGRDVALLSFQGLHILDLDNPAKSSQDVQVNAPGVPTAVHWHSSTQRPSIVLSAAGAVVFMHDLQARSDQSISLEDHERAVADIDASRLSPELIASSSIDGLIDLWDIRHPLQPTQRIYVDGESIRKVKLSPTDSNLLASAHGPRCRIWDLRKPSVPIYAVNAHAHTIRDIIWHAQSSDRVTTCASDGTVKFWNFSRITGQRENASAEDALDQVLNTNSALASVRLLPSGEAMMAFGEAVMLLDCRVRKISDQNAEIEPTKTWPLRRAKAIDVRSSTLGGMECLALSKGDIHVADLDPALLRQVGADPSTENQSEQAVASFTQEMSGQRASSKLGLSRPHPAFDDFDGLLRRKHTVEEGSPVLAHRDVPTEGLAAGGLSQEALNPEQINAIDDDDDDYAVIAGEGSMPAYDPSKVMITPPKRLAGASFAPNGTLVRFSLPRSDNTTQSAHYRHQNHRGIAELITSTLTREVSDDGSDPDSDLAVSALGGLNGFSHNSSEPLDLAVNSLVKTISDDSGEVAGVAQSQGSQKSSILNLNAVDDLLPAKRDLASAYSLLGTPHDICVHNQEVCEQLGLYEHSQAWYHSALLLRPVVPLKDSALQPGCKMVAKRNLVEIKRRDGRGNAIGVDYAFDEPPNVTHPEQRAPLMWANHPFGQSFIKKLLRTFHEMGDVQMLAMLTTVFAIQAPTYIKADQPEEVRCGRVRVRFKNQEKFDVGRSANKAKVSLLDHKDFDRQARWRQNYAEQLYAWGLPFDRLDVLRPNASAIVKTSDEKISFLAFDRAKQPQQQHQHQYHFTPICSVCWELVRGYYVSCPDCDHVTHATCLASWSESISDTEGSCLVGCGCDCVGEMETMAQMHEVSITP